jgi:four helix bundle protein
LVRVRECIAVRIAMCEVDSLTSGHIVFVRTVVLVLERGVMAERSFDHERLDEYRLSIDYVAFSFGIAKSLGGINWQARDQWLRAAQSIPLNIVEGNGKQSLKDKDRFFEIVRGAALECATIHDVLRIYDAINDELNAIGKSNLKRIVSMLTRLIQRRENVAEWRIEYEYEYRDAGYEYEADRVPKS